MIRASLSVAHNADESLLEAKECESNREKSAMVGKIELI
jgi:hypothetical protein